MGWMAQRPKRRAAERDQDAIDQWVKNDWPDQAGFDTLIWFWFWPTSRDGNDPGR